MRVANVSALVVGFYGKLPSHGDFLRRRVPDGFIDRWDPWLQECLLESRNILGDRWQNVYLESPVWRFSCAAGVLAEQSVLGLTAPSIDRVGRCFNLTLVAPLPEGVDAFLAVRACEGFFARAEALALETLAADRIDVNEFDRQVAALGDTLVHLRPHDMAAAAAAEVLEGTGATRWRIGLDALSGFDEVLGGLGAARLHALYDPLVAMWTEGSQYVEPSFLVGRGLPAPDNFAALMTGAWGEYGWRSISVPLAKGRDSDTVRLSTLDAPPPVYRSGGVSDVGLARQVNQDAFLERPEAGIWVVADGLGGHEHGEIASRMVCDALADFLPSRTFEDAIDAAAARMQQVNARLLEHSSDEDPGAITGSTVVALLTRGVHYAVVWAGDSRLYRRRGGQFEQLTQDHSAGEVDSAGHATSAITRAVGAEPALVLDIQRGRVSPGDRFLLCSDGLTRVLTVEQILDRLTTEDPGECARALIKATLDAGAPDNVTVVVVDVHPPPTPTLDIGL
ncbi:MAG: type VI secretion system-associated protein TagF [Vicinamibacterales bacterium]